MAAKHVLPAAFLNADNPHVKLQIPQAIPTHNNPHHSYFPWRLILVLKLYANQSIPLSVPLTLIGPSMLENTVVVTLYLFLMGISYLLGEYLYILIQRF